ncbi:hypothetical protein N9174_02155 [bacterium]|nr:hypothetical protein [bacterium]
MIMKGFAPVNGRWIMRILIFFLGLYALGTPSNGTGTPGRLSATLDRDSAPVGSFVVLTLNYGLPEGARLSPGPEIKGLEELTILDLVQGKNRIRISLLVDRLEAWQTGPLSLSYLDKEGKNQYLKTDPLSLKVLSNLGDKPEEAQLRPIQDIISIKALWLKYLPWGAGFLGILLVVGGASLVVQEAALSANVPGIHGPTPRARKERH